MTDFEIPATGSAEVHVLHEGYVGLEGDGERVSGTLTLVLDGDGDGDVVIVVEPGMVADRGALLAPLGTDAAALRASRNRLREIATVIIPGHGAPFRPGEIA